MRESEKRKVKIYFFLLFVVFIALECFTIDFFYKRFVFYEKGALVAKINNVKIYENDIKLRLNSLEEDLNDDLKTAI